MRSHPLIHLALVAMAVASMLGACDRASDQPKPPANAATVTVRSEKFIAGYDEVGVIEAANSMAVQSSVYGKIVKLIPEGELVEKGQPVVWLEQENLNQQIKEEEITTKRNKNNLDQQLETLRKSEYELKKNLEEVKLRWEFSKFQTEVAENEVAKRRAQLQAKLITQTDLETAERELAEKKLELRITQIALAKAQKQYSSALETMQLELTIAENLYQLSTFMLHQLIDEQERSTLKAPMSGIVIHGLKWDKTKMKIGDQVWYGVKIAEIPDLSSMEVKSQIPEAHYSNLKTGQAVAVQVPALENLELDAQIKTIKEVAIPRKEANGAGFVADDFSSIAKVIETEITLLTSDQRLRPGMNVTVTYITQRFDQVLTIPLSAVATVNGRSTVWLKRGNKFTIQAIELGAQNPTKAVVVNGLLEGAEVLLDHPGAEEAKTS